MQNLDAIARRVWICDWRTIVSIGSMEPEQRNALRIALQARYKHNFDLSEPPDRIRDAVLTAHGEQRSEEMTGADLATRC